MVDNKIYEKMKCDINDRWSHIPHNLLPIDEIDITVLCMLRNDARISNKEIAEALGISEATVRRRIKNLIEKNIILGFSVLINVPAIENSIKSYIELKVDQSKIDEVAKRLSLNPWIIAIYRINGEYDLLLEALFISMKEMQDFMDNDLKLEGIQKISTNVVTKGYKINKWYGL
ncbi:MAG: Lrp/AsnC family transcriptional regulator [Thermoplasmata archaeon]